MKRKGMRDLKNDITDAANTSKEIVQSIYYDAKVEVQRTADKVDEFKQSVVTKSKNAADDIKRGTQDIGQDVKQTSENIPRRAYASKHRNKM